MAVRGDTRQASARPWRARVRRGAAPAIAIALHGVAFAALIVLAPPPPTAPRVEVVNVELAVEPRRDRVPEPAPVSELVRDARGALAPEMAPAEAPSPAPRPQDVAPDSAPQPAPQPSGPAAAEAVLDAPGGASGPIDMPTRTSSLRGLACARSFDPANITIGCEDGPALDFSLYASSMGAAQVEAATADQFNVLAGLYGASLSPAARRLPGQQGIEVMTFRRLGMSGSDEMRDTLPPLVPDPAFGD